MKINGNDMMKPRGSLVLLDIEDEAEEVTEQGIILPGLGSGGGTIFKRATIVELGPGAYHPASATSLIGTDDLRVGMRVIFKAGQKMQRGGQSATQWDFTTFVRNGRKVGLTDEASIVLILSEPADDRTCMKFATDVGHDPIHLGS